MWFNISISCDLLDGISSFEKMGKKVQKDKINKKNTGFTLLGVEGLKKKYH